ncbi:unnamed protein product, partial [Staurois parvus]
MCNMSVSDYIITIPKPALLVPPGPADLCQCWCSRCVWAGLPAVTLFYLPPLTGEFLPGICQSVDPSSSTHCNCHPATASHRYSPSVTLILSLIMVLVTSCG